MASSPNTRPCRNPLRNGFVLTCLTLLLAIGTFVPAVLGQGLDVGGWEVTQENSTASYTLPAGTVIQPGGYLILARFASKAEFEAFYGVTLSPNVVYLTNPSSSPAVPMINGDEIYRLYNDQGGLESGPTPAFDEGHDSHHLTDPEDSPWNLDDDTPTPGWGVEAPDGVFSGLVITETTNASGSGNYIYEYIELYYDSDGGGGNLTPVITSVSLEPAAPADGDDMTLAATAFDSDGEIADIRCYYRFDGGSYGSLAMSPAGGDSYTALLADVPGDHTLEYYVWCEDDEGAVAINPEGAPGDVYSVWILGSIVPGKVVLFDHAHDQDAGSNGNWRVDNNHPEPYPADPNNESDWSGQLSTWGYELYQAGHTIRSNTTALSAALLSDVDLLVIPEPQNPFTAAEIEAVRQFVFEGGSLFFITDHNSSDRNNNGWDSPSIFGGYSQPHITEPVGNDTETFCGALFGLHVHVKDEGNNGISGSYTNVNSDPTNPVIQGDCGEVTGVYYHVGNVMSLWPDANPHLSEVGGLISKDSGSPHLAAWSRYGQGKVVGYGDSSSMADGTGSESHENNWTDASHREFFLNASAWLLAGGVSAVDATPMALGVSVRAYPNPFNPRTTFEFELPAGGPIQVTVFDLAGRKVRALMDETLTRGTHSVVWDGSNDDGRILPSGVYFVQAVTSGTVSTGKVVLSK